MVNQNDIGKALMQIRHSKAKDYFWLDASFIKKREFFSSSASGMWLSHLLEQINFLNH